MHKDGNAVERVGAYELVEVFVKYVHRQRGKAFGDRYSDTEDESKSVNNSL